jgi:hypothetical protein
MKKVLLYCLLLTGFLQACSSSVETARENAPTKPVRIVYDSASPPSAFALASLERVLQTAGYQVVTDSLAEFSVSLRIRSSERQDEGYTLLVPEENQVVLTASDPNGLLYGIHEISEQLSNGKRLNHIEQKEEKAAFPFRAVKFNLPWDSYRRSEALQMHQETCRDLAFWERYLDMMVQNRFNVLTLWNLHPFNYMIRAKNFPEASGFSDQELAEWQQFWRTLFAKAKERGIETYIVNWNIFVSPEFAKAHNVATYSIGDTYFADGDTSSIIRQYTRESVTQVLNEYPDLTGIGVSIGEGMGGMTPAAREDWVLETVVAGMQAADRPVKLIHRAPFSANLGSGGSTDKRTEVITREALDKIKGMDGPIWVEAKFNWSHGHSTPKLVKVHGGPLTDTYWNPAPDNYKMTWMIRNEDFFALRWGDPDFIRQHIALNKHDYVGGYFVGSECYIPADDYFTKLDEPVNWTYAFERQWLFYSAWGRLLYNPQTKDDVFVKAFRRKYGDVDSRLFQAYKLASRVPLRLASLWDVAWDFTLYSEGLLSVDQPQKETQFISVDALINRKTTDPDYVSIKDYVEGQGRKKRWPVSAVTPLGLAETLREEALKALDLVNNINPGNNASLRYEVADVQIWAHLGLYLAEKIRGGVALETFRQTGDSREKQKAIDHLQMAVGHWDGIVRISQPLYKEMPLVHYNTDEKYFHWSNLKEDVRKDLAIAEGAIGPAVSGK